MNLASYGVRHGKTAEWIGDRKQSSVWDILAPIGFIKQEFMAAKHPSMKPVECMERPIRNHSGDVYDPFVGSGSTIIAAERQGRSCFAMEIDPGYVDGAVARWELFTGQAAVHITPE